MLDYVDWYEAAYRLAEFEAHVAEIEMVCGLERMGEAHNAELIATLQSLRKASKDAWDAYQLRQRNQGAGHE